LWLYLETRGQRSAVHWPSMVYMDDVIISKISREAIIKPIYILYQ